MASIPQTLPRRAFDVVIVGAGGSGILAPMKKSLPLSLIAALGENRVIGVDNSMPWHLPGDFKYFKATTLGKPIIMGRKTWDSLPPQHRPLPARAALLLAGILLIAANLRAPITGVAPVTAALCGVLLGGAWPGPGVWLGIAVVIAGLAAGLLSTRGTARRDPPERLKKPADVDLA